jgi:excisionase family DNA binding protein
MMSCIVVPMTETPTTAQWLATDDVMARLGVSRRTVERLRRTGRLPTYRTAPGAAPRFRVEDVDAVLTPDTITEENPNR